MLQALEGSQAVARAVALCRPQVIAAYPITPQTHIVEGIAKLVADGEMQAEVVSVESEFSAASVVLGAAAAGARAYTATASQGILLMSEVLFNIAGMRIPLVLTCANRAVGAPLSIWNDHSDAMAVRDAGWIQLYCTDNQDAIDTTIQAYRIAESCELPVMVCMDGFVLTHTLEALQLPSADEVDEFLPPYRFSRTLDPRQPISLGAFVAPEFFAEMRHAHHRALEKALAVIAAADQDWAARVGRSCGGLVQLRGRREARVGILSMGSIVGTLEEALVEHGEDVRLINLRCFRPFPLAALRAACEGLTDLVVLDRCLSPGMAGVVGTEVRAALYGLATPPRVHNFAVGLGGRDVPGELLPRVLDAARAPDPSWFSILDLDLDKVPQEER